MEGTTTISTILSNIGLVVTQAVSWAGDIVTFIGNNPLIMVFVAIPLVGLGIGMVRRMISL